MAKIAIIINGDSEQRHLDNVERSLQSLEGKGFETYVASPRLPTSAHDFYINASHDEVKNLISQIQQKIGKNDELVIYTTGHGSQKGLCLTGGCETGDIFVQLDKLPYARRVVVMDQPYGGNFGKLFLDDPKTLFVSPGSEQKKDSGYEFTQKFWNGAIPDLNKDAVISWQERYAYAVSRKKLSSISQFVPSPGFVDDGKAPFSENIIKVNSKKGLDAELKKLEPGQYAIVLFYFDTEVCTPCKEYEPKFKAMAKEAAGQHLWIMADVTSAFVAQDYGVFGLPYGYPKVMIINADGDRELLGFLGQDKVLKELSESHLPLEERLIKRISGAEKVVNASDRVKAFISIAHTQINAGLEEQAIPVFEKMIPAVGKIVNAKKRDVAFDEMLSLLTNADLKDKALPVYEKMITATEKIWKSSAWDRAHAFRAIAHSLAVEGLKDKALSTYERSISAAEKIKDAAARTNVFKYIVNSLVGVGFKERAEQLRTNKKIKDSHIHCGFPH